MGAPRAAPCEEKEDEAQQSEVRHVRTFPGARRCLVDVPGFGISAGPRRHDENDSPTSTSSTAASYPAFDDSWPLQKLQGARSCTSLQSRRGCRVALPRRREEADCCDCFALHGYSAGCVIGRSQLNRGFSVVSVTKGGATFAAKVTDEGVGEGILRDTLKREHEILSGLDHNGIVRAVALIEATVGCGMVMEYCSGSLLESHLPAGSMLCCVGRHAVLERILDAVAYLHGQQVAHRDLHAENVMVDLPAVRRAGAPPAAPGVKIIDFGSARLVAAEGGDQASQLDSDISPGIKPPECTWDVPRPFACDVFQAWRTKANVPAAIPGRHQLSRRRRRRRRRQEWLDLRGVRMTRSWLRTLLQSGFRISNNVYRSSSKASRPTSTRRGSKHRTPGGQQRRYRRRWRTWKWRWRACGTTFNNST
ncbi:unnamed protein product [Prorocentrum cordatum]|uniref:Protein kinase domain-containing protein n=1 Tax=Prorocentrum cordatum TaxID=2364126 RepID=A0ABN9QGT6_9DINO|nr:unnamed protein product [Polarella glacialis]